MSNINDFEALDLDHIKQRFNFRGVNVVGSKVYVTSRHDEWYIEYWEDLEALILHHKNKRNVTSRYHREKRRFDNIFHIFGYIRNHDDKILGKSSRLVRMDRLFKQISSC